MIRAFLRRFEPGVPPGEAVMRSNILVRAAVAAVVAAALGPALILTLGPRAWPLVAGTVVLAAVNALWYRLFRRGWSSVALTQISLAVDLLTAIFLLHYFGLLQSGMAFVLAWFPISAGLLLGARATIAQAAACVALYATALGLELSGVIDPVVPFSDRGMRMIGILAGLVLAPLMATSLTMHIATLHRLLRQRQETAERLAELDRLRNEFVAAVSHDLRVPLTAIQGFSRTLIDNWDAFSDEDRVRLLRRIVDNADTLDGRIVQLLEVARIDKEGLSLRPVLIPLQEKLYQLVGRLQPLLRSHRMELSVEPGLVALADEYAFERVVENLLGNAAKYSDPGSRIRIQAESRDSRVIVSVSDEGPGVPAEERERIFERFYRSASSRPRGSVGIGMGLAIAREYLEQHGERIWVESEPGRGSKFLFTLPKGRAPFTPLDLGAEITEKRSAPS